jgi:hypothetical protein
MAKCELCGESESKCTCMNKKPLKVMFCPKCESTKVKFIFKLKNLFGVLPRVRCEKCGFSAPQFPLLIVQPHKLSKSLTKSTNKKTKKSKKKVGGKKK